MKKLVCIILVLSCSIIFWGCSEPPSESDGVFTYTLLENGTYRISAKSTTSVKGNVVIPDEYNGIPVTFISAYGFRDCDEITSVSMGKNITYVDIAAFFRCDSLITVNLPNSLKSIHYKGFVGQCPMLTGITFEGTSSEFSKLVKGHFDTWINTSTLVHCTADDTYIRLYDKNA